MADKAARQDFDDQRDVSRQDYDAMVVQRDRFLAERNCYEAQLRYAHQQLAAQQTMNALPADLAAIQQQLAHIAWIAHQGSLFASCHDAHSQRHLWPSNDTNDAREGEGAV